MTPDDNQRHIPPTRLDSDEPPERKEPNDETKRLIEATRDTYPNLGPHGLKAVLDAQHQAVTIEEINWVLFPDDSEQGEDPSAGDGGL